MGYNKCMDKRFLKRYIASSAKVLLHNYIRSHVHKSVFIITMMVKIKVG